MKNRENHREIMDMDRRRFIRDASAWTTGIAGSIAFILLIDRFLPKSKRVKPTPIPTDEPMTNPAVFPIPTKTPEDPSKLLADLQIARGLRFQALEKGESKIPLPAGFNSFTNGIDENGKYFILARSPQKKSIVVPALVNGLIDDSNSDKNVYAIKAPDAVFIFKSASGKAIKTGDVSMGDGFLSIEYNQGSPEQKAFELQNNLPAGTVLIIQALDSKTLAPKDLFIGENTIPGNNGGPLTISPSSALRSNIID